MAGSRRQSGFSFLCSSGGGHVYWLILILLPSRLNSYSVFNSKISNNRESGTSRDKVPQSFTSAGGLSKTKSTSYHRSICRRMTGNPIRRSEERRVGRERTADV